MNYGYRYQANDQARNYNTLDILTRDIIQIIEYNRDDRAIVNSLSNLALQIRLDGVFGEVYDFQDKLQLTVDNDLAIHLRIIITTSDIKIRTQSTRGRMVDGDSRTFIKLKLSRHNQWKSLVTAHSYFRNNYRQW